MCKPCLPGTTCALREWSADVQMCKPCLPGTACALREWSADVQMCKPCLPGTTCALREWSADVQMCKPCLPGTTWALRVHQHRTAAIFWNMTLCSSIGTKLKKQYAANIIYPEDGGRGSRIYLTTEHHTTQESIWILVFWKTSNITVRCLVLKRTAAPLLRVDK
jgi:hypothetical protein